MVLIKWRERIGVFVAPIVKHGSTYIIMSPIDSDDLIEVPLLDVKIVRNPDRLEKKIRHAMKALGKMDKEAELPLTDTD